jgi:hypothetical protein
MRSRTKLAAGIVLLAVTAYAFFRRQTPPESRLDDESPDV